MKLKPKQYLLFTNIIILIVNIIIFSNILSNKNDRVEPQMQVFDWMNNYYSIQPLLVEYTDKESEHTKRIASERKISNYLNDSRKIIHQYSLGTIRLQFWELGVTKVIATVDGVSIPVRRTDGQYFIDFESKEAPMIFEVTSYAEKGTAKYTFRVHGDLNNVESKNDEQERYNICKEKLMDEIGLKDSKKLFLSGYEHFFPSILSEGYVIKVKSQDNENHYDIYGVDITDEKYPVFVRDDKGNYQLIAN